jgi:steroid delta-isomerase-like uncharacterized protein
MVTTALTKLSQDYLAAFNSHDIDKLLSFYTIDCTLEDTGLGMVYNGQQQLGMFHSNFFQAFPDIKMEFKTDFRSGDWWATESVLIGTNTGNIPSIGGMPEIPATNRNINLKGAMIVQLRGEKINRQTNYWNMATYLMQLGLMPGMPSK